MKQLIGRPGSICGLLLRIGQFSFALCSMGVMISAHEFSNYTAYCYLIASMGLQLLWSFGLACLDVYALRIKRDLQSPVLVSLFVVGDWVTATLSLAAVCSSGGVAILYAKDLKSCRGQAEVSCERYGLSIALAFITWCLVAISSHLMFWILASV